MKRVLVLGGGLVDSAIARGLSHDKEREVTVADTSPQVREALAGRGITLSINQVAEV